MVILIAYYTAIIAYSLITGIDCFDLFVTFHVVGITLHSTHRIGHKRLIREWYRAHTIGHHIMAYPENRYTDIKYRGSPVDSYHLNTIMYVITGTISLSACVFFLSSSLREVGWTITFLLGLIYWDHYIHQQLHHSNSVLRKYNWFRSVQEYHRIHHTHPYKCNYSICCLFIDWIMGTLVEPTS